MPGKWTWLLVFLAAVTWSQASIHEVGTFTPKEGGCHGLVYLAIEGDGFDPSGTATQVYLKDETGPYAPYPCDKEDHPTTATLVGCNTRPLRETGKYNVEVYVNGEVVTANKQFKCREDLTPTIDNFHPRSSPPRTLVKMTGRIITTLMNMADLSLTQVDNSPKIKRIYAGDKLCEAILDSSIPENYGIEFTDWENRIGFIKCMPQNDFVGNLNFSFVIGNPHGRSRPHMDLMYVRTHGLSMLQTYSEAEYVTPSTGSLQGGQRVTIIGTYLDQLPRVYLGDQECEVLEGELDHIVFVTPAHSSTPSLRTGNRGLYLQTYQGSNSANTVDWNTISKVWQDDTFYEMTEDNPHVTKMEAAYVVPDDGSYKFFLRAKGNSVMTLTDLQSDDNVLTLESSTWSGEGTSSDIISLQKDQILKLKVLTTNSERSGVEVASFHYNNSIYNANMTGQAMPQIQCLSFQSTKNIEKQELHIVSTATGNTEGTKEVQKVTVSGDTGAKIQLCLYGVCTDAFAAKGWSKQDLKEALEELPGMEEDDISSVTKQSSNFIVTFSAKLGNVPLMTAKVLDLQSVVFVTVATTTEGASTLQHFRLKFGGAVTKLISFGADADDMKDALNEIAGIRCHPKLSKGTKLMDCETESDCSGKQIGFEEPFCGMYSAKKPEIMTPSLGDDSASISMTSNMLCFAYKGPLKRVKIDYTYTHQLLEEKGSIYLSVNVDEALVFTSWQYSCKDIFTPITNAHTVGTNFRLDKLVPETLSNNPPLYVDQVYLTKTKHVPSLVAATAMRAPQARPSDVFIKDNFQVTKDSSTYSVKIKPRKCGYNIDLISIDSAVENTVSSETSTFRLESASQTEITMTTTRTQAASPPIRGSFGITYKEGHETAILTPEFGRNEFLDIVRNLHDDLKGVGVESTGGCHEFEYCVSLNTVAGDQPLFTLDTALLTGLDVTATVESRQSGGVLYKPILGDTLRTLHDAPQLRVYTNDIPVKCGQDGNCSFLQSEATTPTISTITPPTGDVGTQVTITGTGFTDGTTVFAGDSSCDVTSVTSGSLTCTMSEGTGGTKVVVVTVPTLGKAANANSRTFTFQMTVSGINPASGSTCGGRIITVSGTRLSVVQKVTVGGVECPISALTTTSIVCTVPAQQSGASTTATVDVIQENLTLTAPQSFTYSSALTPELSSQSKNSTYVWGGDTISFVGTGFGSSAPTVSLNGVAVQVTSHTDTTFTVTTPPMEPGSYPWKVLVNGKGYACSSAIANINYVLTITGVSPNKGSLYGGTLLTIAGDGFGTNKSIVEVQLGSTKCDVISLNNDVLTCRVQYSGKTYVVTNNGIHVVYGEGYAYEPQHLTIKRGDIVRWEWHTPYWIDNIALRISQTEYATALVDQPGGFTSGSNTPSGVYARHFNETGDIHYWSGYLNGFNFLYLRGKITVEERGTQMVDLKVLVAGMEALHEPASSGSSSSSTAACSGAVSGCTGEPNPDGASTVKFVFSSCHTPVVTTMNDVTDVTSSDTITFHGNGFGEGTCANEIRYGGVAEGVEKTTSSSTQLSFKIDPNAPRPFGVPEFFDLLVANLGYAAFNDRDSMTLEPAVTSLSPSAGSKEGGTWLTITGSGFANDQQVLLQGLPCDVQSSTLTQVVCLTRGVTTEQQCNVSVQAIQGLQLKAKCPAGVCTFDYQDSLTPTVTDVSPTELTQADTSLTLTGTGFGADQSLVSVTLGGVACAVASVSDTQVVCSTGDVPAGTHKPKLTVAGKGLADADSCPHVTSQALLNPLNPASGSIHGGTTVSIAGHGFDDRTTVQLGGAACTVKSMTLTSIVCETSAHAAESVTSQVTSDTLTFPARPFEYAVTATPVVTSISPQVGMSGTVVTISGSEFSSTATDNTVLVGNVQATVTSAAEGTLVVTVGDQMTGKYPLAVKVAGRGFSNSDVFFNYTVGAVTFSPATGTTAGGQDLTVTGSGFLTNDTTVQVCEETCKVDEASVTATQVHCLTPAHSAGTCQVTVVVNDVISTAQSTYTYDQSITPQISSVAPRRGGTGGGTLITVTGTGFETSTTAAVVTIGKYVCNVQSLTSTQITCTTSSATPGNYEVSVNVNNNGGSAETTEMSSAFRYIDVWSSPYTWGGGDPPGDGDMVVVPPGQILLLDNSTAHLKMLLIQGGELIFDDVDLELHSDNIMIVDGGKLQVGTETSPFTSRANIVLHGHSKSKELPIYGTKVLALRQGTLDLHGLPTPVTWTFLQDTASAGSNSVSLTASVNWRAGDKIVIATTSHRHSQEQTEVREIASVSADGMTLTLTEPLAFEHQVVVRTLQDQTQVTLRAEVGLLTHNIKVVGTVNEAWEDDIPRCEAGVDTGEFATQTCFQGKFGQETGSDQIGAHIMIHAPRPNENLVTVRMSYVEVTHAGQAFRLGRYPVHFHLNGNMEGCYVKGLAIHKAFNRAVNIHGSHSVLVDSVVAYNVKGGAFFLEDGIETGNIFQYNLVTFVRASSSLLNDDITPAAFWVTNPNNIVRHNAAVGGTHFGFWYRMLEHPDGPSKDTNICPRAAPLGEFENNTAHSNGWFGLWIFPMYTPRQGGSCNGALVVATFRTLTAYNNEKGAEYVNAGALVFEDFLLINNENAGIEGKILVNNLPHPYDNDLGPVVRNTKIVCRLSELAVEDQDRPVGGMVMPFGYGQLVRGVSFYNCGSEGHAAFKITSVTGFCSSLCGGFEYRTQELAFHNTSNRVAFRWHSEAVFKDLDGSLTNTTDFSVVPTTGTLPPWCEQDSAMSSGSHAGAICPSNVTFHRFALHKTKWVLYFKNLAFTNEWGTTSSKYCQKRVTHKRGWMFLMAAGTGFSRYWMSWQGAPVLTNMTYRGTMYRLQANDVVMLSQGLYKPDRVFLTKDIEGTESDTLPSSAADVDHGVWYHDYQNTTLSYFVKAGNQDEDKSIAFDAYRCFFEDCIVPEDPVTMLADPSNAKLWSDVETWGFRGGKPQENENVTIPPEKWIIIDENIPALGNLVIQGGLSAADNVSFELVANHIIVIGHLVIGWSNVSFNGSAKIRLRGVKSAPSIPIQDGPQVGSKVIVVYGALDLHGRPPDVTRSRLQQTATVGSNTLTLEDYVDWQIGDEIMVTTTDIHPWHTETFRLTGVAGSVLTLNGSLVYKHRGHREALTPTKNLTMTAWVVLLTRNIVIESVRVEGAEEESFGAYIMVTSGSYNDSNYRSGFARVQHTEFSYTGQADWADPGEPRYSLTYASTTSDRSTSYYSYARYNVFHNGFAPAIGVFYVNNLEVEGNAIHHSVKHAIVTTSKNTVVRNNLMALNIFAGTYRDNSEDSNYNMDAALEAPIALNLVLSNNIVAGSERAGFHLTGQDCDTPPADLWSENEAHSCLSGVVRFPSDEMPDEGRSCSVFSGFTVWNNPDWGIYVNGRQDFSIRKSTFVENGVGLLAMGMGPSSVSHEMQDSFVQVTNCTFVGRTTSYEVDPWDWSDDNIQFSSQARTWNERGNMTALGFPNFLIGSNDAPRKPWSGSMSYPPIKGRMDVRGCHFHYFRQYDGNLGSDCIISTTKGNEDMQFPVYFEDTTLHDVQTSQIARFHIPDVGKINSADCVDMDCDGMKKAMVVDTDGSLLGKQDSYIIPNSAFEWGGDPRRGLGDYRIPTVMLTDDDGARIPVNDTCPQKGVYGTENCTWMEPWNAFNCSSGTRYGMLVIESMDEDTETRRLSPVAVHVGEYVDLLNGPQDHGWCSGYTCRKRLSTFWAIVPLDHTVDLYLTSTTPDSMRFMLLNANPTDCLRLSIYKLHPYRLDVYSNGAYVMPSNGVIRNDSTSRFFLHPENDQFIPSIGIENNAHNYLSTSTNKLYWVQCGPQPILYGRSDVLIVSFGLPAMNAEEFYGEQIINNLAQFLGVPRSKVRIVNVVSEAASSGRRKRQTGVSYFITEIGNTATDNSAPPDLDLAADMIVTETLLYGMDGVLNTTVVYTAIREPLSSPEQDLAPLHQAGTLVMTQHPEGGYEGEPFAVQPMLQVFDTDNAVVDYLGTMTRPWKVQVSIRSGGWGLASLIGNTTVAFVNGTTNFSDLGIDRFGEYVLDFNITEPQAASDYYLRSHTIIVEGRRVKAEGKILTEERLTNSSLHLSVYLIDLDTGYNVTDIDWMGHNWTATATIVDPDVYPGTWEGTTFAHFDPATGVADFEDWRLSDSGVCPVLVTVESWPPDFTLKVEMDVVVLEPWQRDLVVERTATLDLQFPVRYFDPAVARRHAAYVRNRLMDQPDVIVTSHDQYNARGDLGVRLVVEGTTAGVNSTIFYLCDSITNGTTFTFNGQSVSMSPYLFVDSRTFYGVSCGRIIEEGYLTPGIIAAAVIGCVLLLLVPVIAVLWYCKMYPRSKTNAVSASDAYKSPGDNERLEDVLAREDSFVSLGGRTLTSLGLGFKGMTPELPPMPGTPDPSKRPERQSLQDFPPVPRPISALPRELTVDRASVRGSTPAMDHSLHKRPQWRV